MAITLRSFARKYKVRLQSKWTDSNPHMSNDNHPMNHYKCRLSCGGRKMDLYFSMGIGLSGEPSVEDVLDCLAPDCAGYENARSFEEWCGEYGYDTDSRSAHKTYRAIGRQAANLKVMLGDMLYAQLLWKTERM